MIRTPHLFSFGHGYSAQALARLLLPRGWRITGTTRTADKAARLRATGIDVLLPDEDPAPALEAATHLLISAGPDDAGDPALRALRPALDSVAGGLAWAGYLSTTGVYGDHGGAWVDTGLPLHIFRLAGIYGPGRGPFAKVRAGTARQIIKPGQVFSRIHVDDIAQVLAASIHRPDPGAVYNVCDNDPAPPQDVLAHAAHLLDLPEPPREDFATADMTPMARSFYAESKKVSNAKMLRDLGVTLLYPDYRSGLAALLEAECAADAPQN